MIGKITGLSVLLFVAGLTLAAQETKKSKKDAKEPDYVFGPFESYKDEILTLKVNDKEKKFKVPGDTLVGYSTADKDSKTKILKAKEHLKDLKKGSMVSVTFDADGKKVLALGVIVSELPGDKPKGNGEKKGK